MVQHSDIGVGRVREGGEGSGGEREEGGREREGEDGGRSRLDDDDEWGGSEAAM